MIKEFKNFRIAVFRKTRNKVGEPLKSKQHMTQTDLATILGVSHMTVSNWENGVSHPDAVMLGLMANIFDVNVDDFYS